MKKTCISRDWYLRAPDMREYVKVDLPNDYSVTRRRDPHAPGGPANGYFTGGRGRYVKYLAAPAGAGHTILDVDGAYMCAEVYLNGDKLAFHPYGYTPFLVDLSDRLIPGKTNKIAIETNDMQPSTRWYSGAGLYRDVFLWTGGQARIEPWDVFVRTVDLSDALARVRADVRVASDEDAGAELTARIVGADGQTAARATSHLSLRAGEKTPAALEFEIENPLLWDPEHPNLYTLKLEVRLGGALADESETTFGVRTITADARHGLRVNGRTIKLRGGCIHHDHGVLGAAAWPAAEERKISILKRAGFNAVRTAHYPPSLALLEACDRLGVIVMDEAFDMWRCQKNSSDYHLWFEDWWARDIAAMTLRDRNHPCVVSYSIGNEIIERDGSSDGYAWAAKLAEEIRKYDPTRLVTSGICGLWGGFEDIDPEDYVADRAAWAQESVDERGRDRWARLTEDYMKPLDIVGYNYLFERYAPDHELYPDRVIWGSETHALNIYDSWKAVMDNDHVLGDFTWTCYDNLGEAGTGRFMWAREGKIEHIRMFEYPWRMCFQGDMDECGFPRPQAYYRRAVWLGGWEPRIFTTHPEHHGEGFSGTGWHFYDVLDSWTFEDKYIGKPVTCEVYTDADEVSFILNGREMARVKAEKCVARTDIPYEKGALTAVAYKGGEEMGRFTLSSTGAPAQVAVTPEKPAAKADGRDLIYFDVDIRDGEGRVVTGADNELTVIVSGGELMGFYSGEPANEDEYGTDRCHAFHGRALAVARALSAGEVSVTVGGKGLKSGSARVMAEG